MPQEKPRRAGADGARGCNLVPGEGCGEVDGVGGGGGGKMGAV